MSDREILRDIGKATLKAKRIARKVIRSRDHPKRGLGVYSALLERSEAIGELSRLIKRHVEIFGKEPKPNKELLNLIKKGNEEK